MLRLTAQFVVFMSDNGAEGASYEAYPVFGAGVTRVVQKCKPPYSPTPSDRQTTITSSKTSASPTASVIMAIIGLKQRQREQARPCPFAGCRLRADDRPSWLYKMFTSQGGIRVPFILHYPPMTQSPGTILEPFTTVMDIMPTILDLAGARHPVHEAGMSVTSTAEYRGHQVFPMRGQSWASWLAGKSEPKNGESPMGWELHGRAAMRLGNYKIVYMRRSSPVPSADE